jgi:rubrerythrin
LNEVLDFYDRGGDFHDNQAALLTPRNYTIQEKDAIVALLNTLTDPRLAAGTLWADVPASWACPDCGVAKSDFEVVEV